MILRFIADSPVIRHPLFLIIPRGSAKMLESYRGGVGIVFEHLTLYVHVCGGYT